MDATPLVVLLAIDPKTNADRAKLGMGLATLMAEDPTLRVNTDTETGKVVIAAMGELHLEIIVDRLEREFGVEATVGTPQVAYKETITRAAAGEGRYIKQTGGHSEYAHAKIRLTPRKRGEGYEFENAIVGGTIPKEFIKPIEQGIRQAMTTGVLAGYPIDDVLIDLYDGSYHGVDSNEMAFEIAGSMAFKDAAKKAHPVLLEPVMRVEVTVPEEYMGDVIGDMTSRRGQLESMESHGDTRIVNAHVPLSEMFGYATDLRLRTDGQGSFLMTFYGYQERSSGLDDDDGTSRVGAPRRPAPHVNDSSIALPEPDDSGC